MIVPLAIAAWLVLGLAVALVVGAGVHAPDPARPRRRYVPTGASARRGATRTGGAARSTERVLYIVERGHRQGRPRRLARLGDGAR